MQHERPRLKILPSRLDRGVIWISFLGIVLMWVYATLQYPSLPDIIPSHFNASGQPDNYGSKWIVFILPAIITIVYAGLSILCKYPHIFNYPQKITVENAKEQYTIATRLIRVILLIVVIFSLALVFDSIYAAKSNYSMLKWWVIPIFMFSMILPIVISVLMFKNKKEKVSS